MVVMFAGRARHDDEGRRAVIPPRKMLTRQHARDGAVCERKRASSCHAAAGVAASSASSSSAPRRRLAIVPAAVYDETPLGYLFIDLFPLLDIQFAAATTCHTFVVYDTG